MEPNLPPHGLAEQQESGSIVELAAERLSAEVERVSNAFSLAAAEAKLSLLGLVTLVIAGVLAAALSLVAWGLLVAVIAALTLQLTGWTFATVLSGLAIVHVLIVLGLLQLMRRVSLSIGFPKSRRRFGVGE